MINNLLILDTETNGLDSTKDAVIEVGAVLYNIEARSIISQMSFLVPGHSNKCEEINHISQRALDNTQQCLYWTMYQAFIEVVGYSDGFMAHNAEFDKNFLMRSDGFKEAAKDKPWVCSKNDCAWPLPPGSPLNLIHIAANLGVPVIDPHRALTDCKLLASCLDKIEDLELFIKNAITPRSWYKAHLPFQLREEAKAAGFIWNPDKKLWMKKMSEKEASNITFMISEV